MNRAPAIAIYLAGVIATGFALAYLQHLTGAPDWAWLVSCFASGWVWSNIYDRLRRSRRDTTKRRPARRRRRPLRRARDIANIRPAVEWVIHHDPRSVVDENAYQRLHDALTARPLSRHALDTAWTRKTYRILAPRHSNCRSPITPITLDKDTP